MIKSSRLLLLRKEDMFLNIPTFKEIVTKFLLVWDVLTVKKR